MKELFASSELAWIVPLFTVCIAIILITGYALREDFKTFFKSIFMPKEQRYRLPVPILSKPEDKQGSASKKPKKEDPVPKPHGDYVPSQFTIIDKAQFTSNLHGYKPPKGALETTGIMIRWYWRKITRKLRKTSEHGAQPQTYLAQPLKEPQIPAAAPKEPVKVMLSKAAPTPEKEPAPEREIKPQTPAKKEPEAKPAPAEEPRKELPQGGLPSSLLPKTVEQAVLQNYKQEKVFTGERILFFFILVILSIFIIFLGAQVSRLTGAVERQNAYIQDLQNRVHPKQPQKRVVIYDIPAPIRGK